MKIRNLKTLVSILFMAIFAIKMCISVAPLFLYLDNTTVKAVILQLEDENKTDKDSTEKDIFKEKKVFSEYYLHVNDLVTFIAENQILHNQENSLYKQAYHPVVPTPPPNV